MATKPTSNIEDKIHDVRDLGDERKEFMKLLARERELYRPTKDAEEQKQLKKDMARILAIVGYKRVATPEWNVTFTAGENVTISKEKLLELGVPVKTIEKATVRTTWESVTVTPVKSK